MKDKLALTPKTVGGLINFHQDGLDQYKFELSPTVIYLETQTIKALKLLAEHPELLQLDS